MVSTTWAGEDFESEVVGISDGDTSTVLHYGTQTKICPYGIDIPEGRQAFGKNVKEVPRDTDWYDATTALGG